MSLVGYAFLHQFLALTGFAVSRAAQVRPVTRVMPADGLLAVPAHVAPQGGDPLDHVLFALKHEGVNLQLLVQALSAIPAQRLLSVLRQTPNGQYIRIACYLWEAYTGQLLAERPEITAGYVDVFDPARYITGPAQRDARWRVNFKLGKGLLLPVSVAMKRNEAEYLAVLQGYSRQARAGVQVIWIDEGEYRFEFKAGDAIFRYWDATACVEFGFQMATQALDVELRKETRFLARYDQVIRRVDAQVDLRGSDLATLVVICLDNDGVISRKKRKRFADRVPQAAFELIEAAVRELGENEISERDKDDA